MWILWLNLDLLLALRVGCMVLLDHVSEGQLNERLMNAVGSDEPITRTRSVYFLSKNHSVTLPSL